MEYSAQQDAPQAYMQFFPFTILNRSVKKTQESGTHLQIFLDPRKAWMKLPAAN